MGGLAICVLACCCLIIISGHLVFEESNTIEVNNWYKLPDESVEVAEIIYKDTDDASKYPPVVALNTGDIEF